MSDEDAKDPREEKVQVKKSLQLHPSLGSVATGKPIKATQSSDYTPKACTVCNEPVSGRYVIAMGKTWHMEHFTCHHCKKPLGSEQYFEENNQPYCAHDYYDLFRPKCATCKKPILGVHLIALGATYHMEHFICTQCGKEIGDKPYYVRDGFPYCKQDYGIMFAPKCMACKNPIMDNCISAMKGMWHASCFVCRDCAKPITGKNFFPIDGYAYCGACVEKQGITRMSMRHKV